MNIKRAARTVIVDENNLIALIDVRNGEYYKIPGGGIEEGETEIEAAMREASEEAGCEIVIGPKIGENEFLDNNSEYGETVHHSVCFLAKKVGESKKTSFNEWEKSNNMKLIWVTVPQALKLFENVSTTDEFASKINERDYNFVLKAKELLK